MTNNPYQAPTADLARDDQQSLVYDDSSWLSTKGREGRSNFITFSTICVVVALLAISVATQLGAMAWVILIVGVILFLSTMIRLQVRRLHDLGMTGWIAAIPFFLNYLSNYVGSGFHSGVINDSAFDTPSFFIFMLISAYFAALGFIPGSQEKNEYAAPPRPPAIWAKVIAAIMSVVMMAIVILGIIGFFVQA